MFAWIAPPCIRKAFGAEIYAAIQKPEGESTEVDSVGPEPGPDDALDAKPRRQNRR